MDLQEASKRILLGHWMVIVAFVVVCMGAVTAYSFTEAPTYSASTRVVLDVPAPTSGTEATAVADAAKAIVTSPTHVAAALSLAGVLRDPVKLIANITLVPVGTSGVLQLTVQDVDPVVAANLANALAQDLIKTRLAISPAAEKAALDDQIASLNVQLQALQVDPANVQAAVVRAQILTDRINVLESERASLGSVSDTTPTVIDAAAVPTKPDPSKLPIELALALIIGSVLGVVVASGMETFRPTLAGGDAVAKALGVPVLGWLPDTAGTLARRVKLAATANSVRAVELIAVGDSPELAPLTKSLRDSLGEGRSASKGPLVYSVEDAPRKPRTGQPLPAGFVVVAPDRMQKEDLKPVQELISISGRPLLGVIAYRSRRRQASVPAEAVKPWPRLAVLPDGEKDPVKGMSKEMQSDLWGAQ